MHNSGLIADSLAPEPLIEWQPVEVTPIQRAAFGAMRPTPGLVVSTATEAEWLQARKEFREAAANVREN